MTTATDTTDRAMGEALAPRADAGHVCVVGVAFFSDDPHRLTDFYERLLGLAFQHRPHADGREHWIAGIDDVRIEVKATRSSDGTPTPDAVLAGGSHSSVEVSLRVDDAAAKVLEALELGARPHLPVIERAWGCFGVVLDPDGNRLGLFAPPVTDATPVHLSEERAR